MRTAPNLKPVVYIPIIVMAVLTACLLVWPLGLIGHTSYTSASKEEGLGNSVLLYDGSFVRGEFVPEREGMDEISFQFQCNGPAPDSSYVELTIFDSNDSYLYSTVIRGVDIRNNHWTALPLTDVPLNKGQTYAYQLHAFDYDEDTNFSLYAGSPLTAPKEMLSFYNNGFYDETRMPAIIFNYSGRPDKAHALPYDISFILIGLLFFLSCSRFTKTNEEA